MQEKPGLIFRSIELTDIEKYTAYTSRKTYKNIEGGFACAYIWRHKYGNDICVTENALYLRGLYKGEYYITPLGVRSWELAVEESASLLPGASFIDLNEDDVLELEKAFPDRYNIEECEDRADYLYLQKDLAELSGKKYHQKRNHCSKFERTYGKRWVYEEINRCNIGDVWKFNEEWRRKDNRAENGSLKDEAKAICVLISNMEPLKARGGLLRVDGKVIAFTAGAPVSGDVFDICVEKADYEIDGAYPMICREFIKNTVCDFTYINREDDMGIPNLRKAKKSYHPIGLVKKYTASLRRVEE